MGMHLIVCTLSQKRRNLVEHDAELVREVLLAERSTEIPGLYRVGKPWEALGRVVEPWDSGSKLRGLLSTDGGRALGEAPLSFGKPRIFDPDEVRDIAAVLDAIPADACRTRVVQLRGVAVHGNYFQPRPEAPTGDADLDEMLEAFEEEEEQVANELQDTLVKLRTLLRGAASKGESLLACIV